MAPLQTTRVVAREAEDSREYQHELAENGPWFVDESDGDRTVTFTNLMGADCDVLTDGEPYADVQI